MTLYARQQKRHRCVEWTFALRGRGRGCDDLGEWHWNMYTIMQETNLQSMSDAGYRMLGAGAWGWPREMLWGGRWEGGSCLGSHVHPWWIHVNMWQNQYNNVKQNKVKTKIKKKKRICLQYRRPGFYPWIGRKWQTTAVFLPGESRGQKRPVHYHSWGGSQTWLSLSLLGHEKS